MIINYDINNKGGEASAEGCVRYDQQQELTDEQKQQAKDNLGIEDPETQEVFELSDLDSVSFETFDNIKNSLYNGKSVIIDIADSSERYQITELSFDFPWYIMSFLGNGSLHRLSRPSVGPPTGYAEHDVIPIPADAVLYTAQTLTAAQQQQARANIGAGTSSLETAVRYDEAQDLDEDQKAQARENIGAAGGCLFELEGEELEDMTAEEFLSIYGSLNFGHEAFVSAGCTVYKLLAEKLVMTRNYDDLFLYFLNSDGTIEEICLHDHYNPEIEFRKLGAAENHQLLKSALSEAMGCSAGTWHTLAEVTVPEDGVYQVSASVRAQPYSESTYSAVTACIEIYDSVSVATELQEIQLPRSGEYGTMAVPVEVHSGKTLRLRAYSAANFYAQAAPSVGKASATFIAAVRIGAIYR